MEWDKDEARASDVVDQRGAGNTGGGGDLGDILGGALGGAGGRGAGGGGGLGGVLGGMLGGKGKKGGIVGVLLVLAATFILPRILAGSGFDVSNSGLDLPQIPNGGQLPGAGDATDASLPVADDPDPELTQFANVLITDTNNIWADQFEGAGKDYDRTKLVLFTGGVNTACGQASADMGPFYCPGDHLVYIDLTFFEELASRFGAAGDFAQAYVIAHEVGHHVQDELGISAQVRRIEQDDPGAANGPDGLSVRTELQADCLAGVWAHTRYERGQADPAKRLDDGDIDEALRAAAGV
ncbi:MAG: neutral zinc metallopeptidase, partial [Gemmataceae bacterium]|nr:neutral zinc metallopeptidase [Gemmataceae bacterium]